MSLQVMYSNRLQARFSLAMPLLISLVCLLPPCNVSAGELLVSSAAQISSVLPMVSPGDVLVMQDGVWTNQQIDFAAIGTQAAPITLRAQTPGAVKLTGNSKLTISGDWLVVDGLHFENGALGEGEHIVRFQGPLGEATNSRFTNSAIVNYNPADIDTRYFWVTVEGKSNRVDHNHFSGHHHSGVTLSVVRDTSEADFHRIDNNHFADRPPGNDNGFETIRIGTSTYADSDSYTTVENNLFERIDGEIEIISSKSGSNVYQYNTFRESAGTLTLRHGNDNSVRGNFFLGAGKDSTGGVRVVGERQVIVNNYFHELDGRAGGAISITAGVPNPEPAEYVQVVDTLIAHNTIVDVNEAAITFDNGLGSSGRTLLGERITIANNLISSDQDPLFEGNEGSDWLWIDNLAYGQSLGPKAGHGGIAVVDPRLTVGLDELYRLSATSPAIDAVSSGASYVIEEDYEGQSRVGLADIGADEFSSLGIARMPLRAQDVGPSWFNHHLSSQENLCTEGACMLQAEDYTQLLDPDGDQAIWTTVFDEEAYGGVAIKATSGDRVDLSNEEHDTLVTYELEFDEAGTYFAYVRARGFDSSSDSFYAPDSLEGDPESTETTSSNGQFEWRQVSVSIEVGASSVALPVELRFGMRERDTELDAIVLSLDNSLGSEDLDQMYQGLSPTPGDYNGDGRVDAADYTVWRDGNRLVADGDGNGIIDAGDYAYWSARYSHSATESIVVVPEHAPWLFIVFTSMTIETAMRMRCDRI